MRSLSFNDMIKPSYSLVTLPMDNQNPVTPPAIQNDLPVSEIVSALKSAPVTPVAPIVNPLQEVVASPVSPVVSPAAPRSEAQIPVAPVTPVVSAAPMAPTTPTPPVPPAVNPLAEDPDQVIAPGSK